MIELEEMQIHNHFDIFFQHARCTGNQILNGFYLRRSIFFCDFLVIATLSVTSFFLNTNVDSTSYLEFEVCTLSYGPYFSSRIYGPTTRRFRNSSRKRNKKQGSVTYSTDWENGINNHVVHVALFKLRYFCFAFQLVSSPDLHLLSRGIAFCISFYFATSC